MTNQPKTHLEIAEAIVYLELGYKTPNLATGSYVGEYESLKIKIAEALDNLAREKDAELDAYKEVHGENCVENIKLREQLSIAVDALEKIEETADYEGFAPRAGIAKDALLKLRKEG